MNMAFAFVPALLAFYGIFLIVCGIVSVVFIGMKAKTALASGGLSGFISLLIAYLVSSGTCCASIAGIVLSFALFVVFSWRSAKTLFKIFELLQLPAPQSELNGKGIAFLIISLMAMVSIIVFALQVIICISS